MSNLNLAAVTTSFHEIEARLDRLMTETGYAGHVIVAALLGFETEPKEIAATVQAAWKRLQQEAEAEEGSHD